MPTLALSTFLQYPHLELVLASLVASGAFCLSREALLGTLSAPTKASRELLFHPFYRKWGGWLMALSSLYVSYVAQIFAKGEVIIPVQKSLFRIPAYLSTYAIVQKLLLKKTVFEQKDAVKVIGMELMSSFLAFLTWGLMLDLVGIIKLV